MYHLVMEVDSWIKILKIGTLGEVCIFYPVFDLVMVVLNGDRKTFTFFHPDIYDINIGAIYN